MPLPNADLPPDARPEPTEPTETPEAPRPCTVLYVEDHPVNVLLMQSILARRPHVRLVVATTGEEGWAAARAERPDLLLLDLHLPDCHGTDLLRRLREDPSLARVPAVAVTADTAADVHGAGFLEVWRKPMDVHATLARIDALLAHGPDGAGTPVAAGGVAGLAGTLASDAGPGSLLIARGGLIHGYTR